MEYQKKLQEFFEKRPYLSKPGFAEFAGFDRDNFNKYCNGQLKISEKTWKKIIEAIEKIKNSINV